jgi:hypothetical protein
METFPTIFGSAMFALLAWMMLSAIAIPSGLALAGASLTFLASCWLMFTRG